MSYKILIADDEAEIRDVLHLYLEKDGYEVYEAADGIQAMEVLQKEKIDLAILDIMMPGIDGYRVLRNIREDNNIPVIILSAQSSDSAKILGLDLESCMLYRAEAVIELTSVEFKIMKLFMENPGKVFTKQQIFEQGWEEEYMISDNNVMVCISKLRSKLDTEDREYIRTIRGLGYRLEKE